MFMICWDHLAVIAFIYMVAQYCVALEYSARKATKLVRTLRQLMEEVRKFWRN